ncbi:MULTISPECIES: 4a-hydroxytetrahydrobiopterin dehydratase [Okeania]|uniref:Putative pterin-4-alpha-carbinolamine dehydratase n=1 Tax=Okeania hirsuta TaxID=1458930 RepID=A0A3N6PQ28_9CYAN|nr:MULTISPECIES: 4a-hydroxytetrahydrobiopterin dehydratase [Okeania]NEP06856.1 4a-hydroxytetrahydrobiopterin dehydratase [Okeania sp. SIO4D6]NEP40912.1 4a-hydroxytetrahydrobiopterin dehydratase [Okeania sp. SIO2H7]NET12473.1 4a-hydroxytetrahydrobiopterin dehydratase [Okeania sp. SIO1H6]NEP75588.1 4a-hydroxytetrahydrobiopterin dehydratase [Okeania sp. SIO2G5]NEP96715.1 4a-hydroxytetrahydrobiopterin dehydratase [Okeania sp. SIO2F5]
MSKLLSAEEISQRVSQLSDWKLEGNKLQCVKIFKNFVEAISFVNQLVDPAEASQHHPDIEISYNKVIINLTTHDVGSLTEKDFSMAKQISALD